MGRGEERHRLSIGDYYLGNRGIGKVNVRLHRTVRGGLVAYVSFFRGKFREYPE